MPQWLRDEKFGIYTHWGIYSVPACGPNVSWYGHNMYREGTEQYAYHVRTYGHPSQFGYKDFLPMFRGAKFDPDEWAELFQKAGARFAGPVAVHHDGFAMWDSALTDWNSSRLGPRRDVTGELQKAIRRRGMKFLTAFHHAENWWYFPKLQGYDTTNPLYEGLYSKRRPQVPEPSEAAPLLEKPTPEFLDRWIGEVFEVVVKYEPDFLWFDFGLGGIQEQYKLRLLEHYYNRAVSWNREVAVAYKYHTLAPGAGLLDLECGRMLELAHHDWIIDTTVDDGEAWGHMHNARYKTVSHLIHCLMDTVSKNGCFLLNVGPTLDGEIPDEAKAILRGMGDWLAVNGEAVYGTTPWMVYGEGPSLMKKSGAFSEREETRHTAQDIRFTAAENALYATCLGWPGERLTVASWRDLYPSEIQSVRMLGVDRDLRWSLSPDGLTVHLPRERPCAHAYVFKALKNDPILRK